jgi:hypothetical protein
MRDKLNVLNLIRRKYEIITDEENKNTLQYLLPQQQGFYTLHITTPNSSLARSESEVETMVVIHTTI